MARRLRPLTVPDLSQSFVGCGDCVFWESYAPLERRCGSRCDAEALQEWFARVVGEWGECGRVVIEDDSVLGFVKYAPSAFFPQAFTFSAMPDNPRTPLVACLHVASEATGLGLDKVLLHAALRDLTLRGERQVQAFGRSSPVESGEISPAPDLDLLVRNGFTVARADPSYPLMQLELRSLAMIAENLESVLESLRIPLRSPRQAPVPGA